MRNTVKVLLIQDHELYGECLQAVLTSQTEFRSVQRVTGQQAAEGCVTGEETDLVLVHAGLRDGMAWTLCRDLRAHHDDLPVLVFDVPSEREMLLCAEAGATGCLPCESDPQDVAEGCLRAVRGETTYPRRLTPHLVSRLSELCSDTAPPLPAALRCPTLTPREVEVLELVALGLANKEIAGRLFISPNTVRNHVHNILDKLQVTNRSAAVAYALRERWISLRGGEAPAPYPKQVAYSNA